MSSVTIRRQTKYNEVIEKLSFAGKMKQVKIEPVLEKLSFEENCGTNVTITDGGGKIVKIK